jgi:hypothetical protein
MEQDLKIMSIDMVYARIVTYTPRYYILEWNYLYIIS